MVIWPFFTSLESNKLSFCLETRNPQKPIRKLFMELLLSSKKKVIREKEILPPQKRKPIYTTNCSIPSIHPSLSKQRSGAVSFVVLCALLAT